LVENRHFFIPPLHSTPPLGGTLGGVFPSEYRHPVWYGKTRMVWLPDGEKISDMFIRFDLIHERDGQTDGHRITANTALMHRHRAVKTDAQL